MGFCNLTFFSCFIVIVAILFHFHGHHTPFGLTPSDTGIQRRALMRPSSDEFPHLTLPGNDILKHEEGLWTNDRGMNLFYQKYIPVDQSPKAVILMLHGYSDSTNWFQRTLAVRLVKEGFLVIGIDYEGHGRSDGLHVFINDFDALVDDVLYFSKSQRVLYPSLPWFVFGESMGGAVAFKLCTHKDQSHPWAGFILQAPMCKISDSLRPPEWQITLLNYVSELIPTARISPTESIIHKAFKVKEQLDLVHQNPYRYTSKPRLKTAFQLLSATDYIAENLDKFDKPLLILHGEADTVTDPNFSKHFYERASSTDKTIKIYDGVWHAIMQEPEENVNMVLKDLFAWLDERTKVSTD